MKSLDTAQLRLTELREDIGKHVTKYSELKVHSDELARDCKSFRETQGELTRHNDTLKSANSDLTKQIDDIRTAKDGIKDAITLGNASLQLEVRQLKEDNARLVASSAAQVAQSSANVTTTAADARRLQQRIKELETANDNHISAATHLKEVYKSDLSSQRDAQASADKLNLANEEIITTLRSDLETANADVARLLKNSGDTNGAHTGSHRSRSASIESNSSLFTASFAPTFNNIRLQVQENVRQSARVESILNLWRQSQKHQNHADLLRNNTPLLDEAMRTINARIRTLEEDTNTRTVTTTDVATMQRMWSVESHRDPMYVHELSSNWDAHTTAKDDYFWCAKGKHCLYKGSIPQQYPDPIPLIYWLRSHLAHHATLYHTHSRPKRKRTPLLTRPAHQAPAQPLVADCKSPDILSAAPAPAPQTTPQAHQSAPAPAPAPQTTPIPHMPAPSNVMALPPAAHVHAQQRFHMQQVQLQQHYQQQPPMYPQPYYQQPVQYIQAPPQPMYPQQFMQPQQQ